MTERKITFGKYKGQPIKKLLLEHTGYILWCLMNLKWFSLDDEEQALYDAMAIAILKDKPNVVYPIQNLIPFIKDKEALEKRKSPFYIMGTGIYPYNENDPVVQDVLKYRKSSSRLDLYGLTQVYNKQVNFGDDFNGIDTEDIDSNDFI